MNFRDYCFVVGREKRSIEDHFTPHETYLKELNGDYKKLIRKFYQKLENSHLVWINQNRPLGFGDAVKRAERYVGKEDFIVHAGDVTILSRTKHPVSRLIETAKKNPHAKAILLCKKIKDSKRYGVPTINKLSNNLFLVKEVIEKPEKPKSSPILPSGSNGITNSPSRFPLTNIFLSRLLINLGRKMLVIFVKSFISFLTKATSALFNKKSELKKDLSDKNKSNFDRLIALFLIKIFGFCSFTERFNSFILRCIFVFWNSNLTFRLTALALVLIKSSNLSVFIPK